MLKKLIKSTIEKSGYVINKKVQIKSNDPKGSFDFVGYDYGSESIFVIEKTKEYSMMPYVNIQTLYEQAIYCEKNNIQGSFVECGVWKGGAVGAMAMANLKHGVSRRDLHLFDSFDDICSPNAEIDGTKAVDDVFNYSNINKESFLSGQLTPIEGFYDFLGGHGTVDDCSNLLFNHIKYPREHVHFHKGWFQDTLPKDADKIDKIAILRLDGDWYDSIKICLDYLYDKVAENGIVIIDDYGYYQGCTKAVDDFFKERNIITFLSYSSVGCRYFIKRK
jgi:hypothetical protein